MDLFGRRARLVELPATSAALNAGLYAGTYAGLNSAYGGDPGTLDCGTGADRRAPEGGDVSQVAQHATNDSAAASTSHSWSGSDGSGGGDWWSDGNVSGDWSCDFGV